MSRIEDHPSPARNRKQATIDLYKLGSQVTGMVPVGFSELVHDFIRDASAEKVVEKFLDIAWTDPFLAGTMLLKIVDQYDRRLYNFREFLPRIKELVIDKSTEVALVSTCALTLKGLLTISKSFEDKDSSDYITGVMELRNAMERVDDIHDPTLAARANIMIGDVREMAERLKLNPFEGTVHPDGSIAVTDKQSGSTIARIQKNN